MATKNVKRPGSLPTGSAAQVRRSPDSGASLWLLAPLYMTLVLAPLGFAFLHDPITSHATVDIVASMLGMLAFAALLADFLFSGRTRWISGRLGVRRTMRIHRWMAYAIIAGIAVHPFLYTAPDNQAWPWFNADNPTLILSHWSLITGLSAWILTAAIIFIAVDHKQLPGSYRAWRFIHAGSALLLGVLIAIHAISAGGYSSQPFLASYWILLLLAGLWMLIEMFLVQPRRQRRVSWARKRKKEARSLNTGQG